MRDKKTTPSANVLDLGFETVGPVRRTMKKLVVNPLANYTPAVLTKALLRVTGSELAAANWKNPGGWRSMVISYDNRCGQLADRLLVKLGTIPMALRNRKRLASHLIATLIDQSEADTVQVLCLGAGPGQIILDALEKSRRNAHATLVDLSSDAFDYGLQMAEKRGLKHRVRYIQADVRDLSQYLNRPPHVVKMIGICEYLTDEQIVTIARAAAGLMPVGAAIVFNSISKAHGTDRFFRHVFGLHIVHRSPEHLGKLMTEAGFGDFQTHVEPLGVYHVIVGRKIKAPAS